MSQHHSRRRGISAGAILGLVAAPLAVLAPAPAQAAPSSGLVISEAYGGGGNGGATYSHDFVELYNPTANPITVTGMSVQYRSQTGNTANVTELTGSVPSEGYYLVQQASNAAVGDPLPTPDATGTAAMSGSNGVVILASDTTPVTTQGDFAVSPPANVIDTVGYGTGATTFETTNTGTTLSATTSAQRAASGADTDANNPDFSELTPSPVSSNAASAALSATNPGNKTATTNQAITPFTLEAAGGKSPYTWTASGLPNGITVASDGTVSGTPTAPGASNVTATVTDAATPSAGTAQTTFTITVADPGASVPIAEIQGDNTDTSPVNGTTVTTTGVVTAAYPVGGLDGFYLQTGGSPTTPNASDALFVYAGSTLNAGQYPALGTTLDVTGTVSEFSNLTQLTITGPGAFRAATASQPAVVPLTVIPGTDCALPGDACLAGAALDAAREKHEGELYMPTGSYTVTDAYDGSPAPSTSSSFFGEIGLAAESTRALVQPTELYDAQTQQGLIANRNAYNNAHRIIINDGSSTSYSSATGQAFPWFAADHYVRNGAPVTFNQPVVLTYGFGSWKIEPSGGQVVGKPTGKVTFGQNRPATPSAVGSDVKLASFNVLNYFPTTGEEFVASNLGTCSYFNDRAGNPITNRSCNPDGPRGAANAASLKRQQDKIVNAINGLRASIVSLEEIENSAKFGKPRDFALNTLVAALNASAGAGTWAAVPSPSAANLPAIGEEDVIRTAFIYQPADVALVGESKALTGQSGSGQAFGNAREPLAQGFKGAGKPDSEAFAVIVNHFKSKGSGADDGTGQGNANPDRVNQAIALKTFANGFATDLAGSGAVFLTGDFNAYSAEDPVQKIEENGDYKKLDSTTDPVEESYNFGGLDGSLDHVFANPIAEAMVTGVDIWNINAEESVYQEYSRFNSNVTNLYNTTPFRASDHNPEIVGLDLDAPVADTVPVQILATNDFHGRIANDPFSSAAGAAVMAGAVKQLRAKNPNTTFAAAGDLIGASTFESFVDQDKPTIDALNEAGLDVSSVGNHEFDQGYDDLINRVIAKYDPVDNPKGGAEWKYLGANVKFKGSGNPALEGTWMKRRGGIKVGYIGAVTEQLPSLVSPDGIANIQVTDVVAATNAAADDLEASGADVIVLLVHEGAPTTDCSAIDNLPDTSDFGSIVQGVNDKVDAIVSGHTHLAYNCSLPVDGWSDRPVTERPVVSAGQYGSNLNRLIFNVDPTTGEVQTKTQRILRLKAADGGPANYPVDQPTKAIVDKAVANAEVLGAQPLGKIEAPFFRAKLANGTTENRGGESTLGNLVAEIQQDATEDATFGSAQIAFMNPGGLRADLLGLTGPYPRTVTFKQAATVQPFANTLVNQDMTGAEIKEALEQQWQPAGSSRPFLKLGVSEGFTYTYDPARVDGERIQAMYLDGEPIDLATTYSVTVNSFLAAGGDNFSALNGTGRKQDTGRTDLQAQVDYFAEFASNEPLPVDFSQRGVGVDFADDAPATYAAGDEVAFDLTSLSMTGPGDLTDTAVDVSLDGASLGTFPVTTTVLTSLPGDDEAGRASATVTLPGDLAAGDHELLVTGSDTGTQAIVAISVEGDEVSLLPSTTDADIIPGKIVVRTSALILVKVTAEGVTPTGTVEVRNGDALLKSRTLANGMVAIPTGRLKETGFYTLSVNYLGDDAVAASSDTVRVKVVKQSPNLILRAPKRVDKGSRPIVKAAVNGINAEVTGKVVFKYDGKRIVRNLTDGTARIRLAKLKKSTTVKVVYRGDGELFERVVKRTTIRVSKS